ncbi:L,D-transpeptidase family protein [Phenylobacterium sp.]|uniref:L,D-transpeptidase family protein n=1 Tax=Phenylobacterium sp. TaxID=1871053 RepID=UPI0025F320CD|nr:L,D-transpeptidase family protein [Phenylobacterium sp.]
MIDTRQVNRRALAGGLVALIAAPFTARAQTSPMVFTAAERRAIGAALGLGMEVFSLDDATLSARTLAFARTEAGLRLSPIRIDSAWALTPPPRDLPAEFSAARAGGRLAEWLQGLGPRAPGYRALQEARGRYALLAAAGGWPTVAQGPSLRVGDTGPDVAAVRARLAAEGYGEPAQALAVYDEPMAGAVRAFQGLHGLDADGVVGPATREALGVSAAARLDQIDANLERWRWTRSPAADRVTVDTGFQEAVLFRGGSPALRMRAIVGSPQHPTPMFRSALRAVVFNPPWNVPDSIANNELLPAAARRPGLLESMGIRRVDGRLQQRPGPNNSLGQVKFDLDSPFGVYLHDTPGKGLFARPQRAFSHGCMRLEKPRELAAALLGWSSAEVDAAIAGRATRRLSLRRPVAVDVLHRTVRVEADGRVAFRPDIYGWDRKLTAALGEPAATSAARTPERSA